MNINKGNPLKMGCEKTGRSYQFSFAETCDSVSLLLYDSRGTLKYRVDMDERFKTGSVFSCRISGVSLDKALYCYEVNGEKRIDPYAKTVTDCEWFGISKEQPFYLSRVVLDAFDWDTDAPLHLPYEDCIFYKLHVRGFTKSRTSGVRHKGTFAGVIEKIPYLKGLGITTLELMPAYEYDEMMRFPQFQENTGNGIYTSVPVCVPMNYWGYTDGFHFAPKASFSSVAGSRSDYTTEFKKMVKALHENGIELVMEMYFDRESPAMILDCMRYWVTQYHIDGIHFYGPEAALEAAAADPLLSETKIITVYWNGERGSRKHMANYNTGFQRTARRFLKGDENQLKDFVKVVRENPNQSANLNYITNHNGFTLLDLVSYDRKHNEANGENNCDGEDFNDSWNCGIEGKSRSKKIVALRQRQIKNAFMLLLLAQGTPLILAGDEFENSQGGNNNPYCIDGETTWLNWKKAEPASEMQIFVRELIAFRQENKILHMRKPLMASDSFSCGFPDVSYHGGNAWYHVMENYNRHIGILYCSYYAQDALPECRENQKNDTQRFELIYIAYNMHWEPHELALPKLPEGAAWTVCCCSAAPAEAVRLLNDRMVQLAPRTVAVLKSLVEKTAELPGKKITKSDDRTARRQKNKRQGEKNGD